MKRNFIVDFWSFFGFFAQFIFFLRFFCQWLASEKEGRSVIPISFWYLSILGTILIGTYAFVRRDIVFLLASLCSLFIYLRNLHLIKRNAMKLSPHLTSGG